MARFGLSHKEFLKLTPIEFYLALRDKENIELGRVRPIAEAIRMEAWWLINLQLRKGKKISKKEKIMAFAWDRAKQQTPEQMKNKLKFIAADTANRKRGRKKPVQKVSKVIQEKNR